MSLSLTSIQRQACLEAVKVFCNVPYARQGTRSPKDHPREYMFKHDWGDLVADVARIIFGPTTRLDYVSQRMVGSLVRDEYPNKSDWDNRVKEAGAQEDILSIILNGLDHLRI